MMKIFMNMYWSPVQPLRDMVDKSNGVFVPVSSNVGLQLLNDDWIDKNVIFEDKYWKSISPLTQTSFGLCEMTTAYLVLNNMKELGIENEDILGLCHYRRFFNLDTIERAFKENKLLEAVLSTAGGIGTCGTIQNQYRLAHVYSDFELLHEEAKKLKCFNEKSWNAWCQLPFLPFPCNLVVARKNVFEQWLEDLFAVILPLEYKIDIAGRDNYQKRALGFLAERFTSWWFFEHTRKGIKAGVLKPEFHEDWKPSDSKDQRGDFMKR